MALTHDATKRIWKINSYSDFVHYLENTCRDELILFRGQRQEWPLLPKVARVTLRPGEDLLHTERKMFDSFVRECLSFLGHEPSNDWDRLAIAQHHGLPTRLLDWTKNPLAALWFAVERPADDGRHGVVWVYCPVNADCLADAHAESPFEGARTRVFFPRHVAARIRSQEAAFTVHKHVDGKGFIALNANRFQKDKLQKVLIPAASFANIRFELDRCGVHASLLFPDLEGLSRRIEWQNTLSSDET